MKWIKLFADDTRSIGRMLFNEGCVKLISRDTNIYTANVSDDRIYTVQVRDRGDSLPPELFCNCEDARLDLRCCHMAALLYYIDKNYNAPDAKTVTEKSSPADLKKLFPYTYFDPDGNDDNNDNLPQYRRRYMYFSLANICSRYNISENDAKKARYIVNNKYMKLGSVSVRRYNTYRPESDDDYNRIFTVTGLYYNPDIRTRGVHRASTVSITVTSDNIRWAQCGVTGCRLEPGYYYENSDELCEHEIALLILLDEYIFQHPELNDVTDEDADRFLDEFKTLSRNGIEEEQRHETVSLTPRLLLDSSSKSAHTSYYSYYYNEPTDQLYVDFKIGIEKKYVVKNLPEMIDAYKQKKFLELGKNNGIQFATETFDKNSRKFLDFIDSYLREERFRNEASDANDEMKTNKQLLLYGKRLDDFFSLISGSTIEFADRVSDNRNKQLKAKERELKLTLKVYPHNDSYGQFDGVMLDGDIPDIYSGAEGAYYIEGDRFYRIPGVNYEQLKPFINSSDYGMIHMLIGRQRLSQLYYNVLPRLSDYVSVTESGEETIRQYLPPEAEFEFFLDSRDGEITCHSQVTYGDEVCTLGDTEEKPDMTNFYRDIDKENQVIDTITSYFPDYDPDKGEFYTGRDEDAVYNILSEGVSSLMDLGEVSTTQQFENLNIKNGWHLSVGVSVEADLLHLSVLSDDIPQEELLDILESFRQHRKFHRLKDGNFISIEDNDSVAALSQMMDDLHVSVQDFTAGKMDIPVYRALYLDKMLETHDEISTDRDRNFKSLIKNFKTVKDADYEVPPALKPVLRNYQKDAMRWLLTLSDYGFGGILADEMGLGKTPEMISALLYRKLSGELKTSIVVCPASLVYNWMSEFEKYAPQIQTAVVDGTKRTRTDIIKEYADYDVLITSYDMLRRDIAEYNDISFDYEILDEAQYIKNPKAGISKAVRIISSQHRFALTGTPIENRLSELWSICDYLMPGFLYDYQTFRTDYETPIVSNDDEDKSKRLSAMTSPFIMRRKKSDVLKDLPEKLEEVRYTSFEESQRKIYDAQLVHMKQTIAGIEDSEFNKNRIKILAEITRLRQICCDPSLFLEGYSGGSAKRDALMELISDAIDGGHKMLVFSQFTSMLELIEGDLKNAGIPYYLITGATAKTKRLELVKQFNADDTPVFLISLKAGGTGLNLTGADIVIHYDPWWNAAAENQATDRAHRIGQKHKVNVYKLIVKGTIEEKILEMQEKKKDLADEILNGEGRNLTQLTKEELMELLS